MALAQRRPYGIYRLLANAPRWFYRLGLGWLLGHRVVQITHRGRKSGLLRRTILEVLSYDPQTREVLVVSSAPHKSLHVVGESRLANRLASCQAHSYIVLEKCCPQGTAPKDRCRRQPDVDCKRCSSSSRRGR